MEQQNLLYIKIADKLRFDISKNSLAILPSIAKLCKQYNVSYGTMMKSTHYLRQKGILDFSQGKIITVVRKNYNNIAEKKNPEVKFPSQKFYEKLKNDIENGIKRCGQELSKISYFTITENISIGTVYKVLRLLEQEGLIHKQKKKWIVGPRPTTERNNTNYGLNFKRSGPVIIILAPLLSQINAMFTTFNSPLTIEFMNELNKHGIGIIFALWERDKIAEENVVSGRSEIFSLIKNLGERYRGALMLSRISLIKPFKEWCEWMCQFKKPVQWFDEGGNSQSYSRRHIHKKEYYRSMVGENSYIRIAVDVLRMHGHKKIGLLDHDWPGKARESWIGRRIRLIKEYAKQLNPTVEIVVKKCPPDSWMEYWTLDSNMYDSLMLKYIHNVKKNIIKDNPDISDLLLNEKIKKYLINEVTSLTSLLREHDITAIIALDQIFAINYYYWFKYVGINIPKDFSIVSLGHNLRYNHHPISSVNPRFDIIGYKLAHIFIGDIPIKTDRFGTITGISEFINRGSVGDANLSAFNAIR